MRRKRKRWYIHAVFRRRRRSRRRSRIGDANMKNSSTLSATRGRRRHDWQQVEIWAICHHRRPAIPAIMSSAITAAGSSIGPPRSGTFRFASVCKTRSRRKHRGDVKEEIATIPQALPSLSAKKKDRPDCTPRQISVTLFKCILPLDPFPSIHKRNILLRAVCETRVYFEIFACFTSNVETISQKVR